MWLDIQKHKAIRKSPTSINMSIKATFPILLNAAGFDEICMGLSRNHKSAKSVTNMYYVQPLSCVTWDIF